jgi:hypothetical protein
MNKSVFIVSALAATVSWPSFADTKVDFVKDIQPILQNTCIKCHGPEKQKGGLRLDSRAAVLKGGKDGEVINLNHADKSDLYRRITLEPGSDDIMPSKGDPLTKAQTDLIRDWINQGAVWPENAVFATEAKPAETSEAPAPVSVFDKMPAIKPTAAEPGAIAKIEALGVAVRPIAMNMNWREANFHAAGTNVTDATVAPLKDIVTVVDLNLAGTKITDAALQNLKGLTNLVDLHLEHTKITDAGLANLKGLANLSYLNLFDTPISDKGLAELKGLKNLQHLYVWQTKVTEDGVKDLQKALPNAHVSRGWENEPLAMKEKEEKKEETKEEKK